MAIRLWPQDYERKEHITKSESALLKNAGRNLSNGHMVVGIDPLGMSTSTVRMGMYISPREGLITFSLYQGQLCKENIEMYRSYIQFVEDGIYSRLLDSKALIIRDGNYKTLKFPYKHIIMFPDERLGGLASQASQLQRLYAYATYGFFQPITSECKEKRISDGALGHKRYHECVHAL